MPPTTVAERYEAVPPGSWDRRGFRSDGSEFTVDGLGRYHLHDIVHHAWDVRAAVRRATVEAYDASAAAYRDGTARRRPRCWRPSPRSQPTSAPAAGCSRSAAAAGRDARLLEEPGVSVRRTDVTPGFVDLLRADGHDADVLDPLTDDLADPARPGTPYDGVWANACLLHVARADLPVVLRRLAAATRARRAAALLGEGGRRRRWSTHGHVSAPPRTSPTGASGPLRAVARGRRVGGRRGRARRRRRRPASPGWLCVPTAEAPDRLMRHTEFWARMDDALGPAYARILGRPVRDRRARRPHGRAGARRGRAAEGGLGGGLARSSSCRRPSDERPGRRRPTWPPAQRRTVRTLVAAQAVGAVGITIGIATASLLARDISGSESAGRPGPDRSRCSAPRSRRTCSPG